MSDLTSNQARGYKATISNPHTSEEAKANAQRKLGQTGDDEYVEPGSGPDNLTPAPEESRTGTDNNRVLGGHKAALHNPNTSEEAKQHAREVLDSAGATDESKSGVSQSTASGDQHSTRVLAGYKATLSNPNTSDEAKEHAEEVLQREGAI